MRIFHALKLPYILEIDIASSLPTECTSCKHSNNNKKIRIKTLYIAEILDKYKGYFLQLDQKI